MTQKTILSERDFQKELSNLPYEHFIRRMDWVSENGRTPLMFLFTYNATKNLNFNQAQIMQIVSQSDLNAQTGQGTTSLMFLTMNNVKQKLNLTTFQILSIIERSDLTLKDENGVSNLIHILANNGSSFNLNYKQIAKFIQTNDFLEYDKNGMNVVSHILNYNSHLKFPEENILSFLNKIDLKHQDAFGYTPLMYILESNFDEKLNIQPLNLMKIIEKSDLKVANNSNKTPLMILLEKFSLFKNYNSFSDSLSNKQLKTIIKGSDLNAQDHSGKTPLMYAARYCPSILLQLLAYPQNVFLCDHDGHSVIDILPKQQKELHLALEKAILHQQGRQAKAVSTKIRKL